jgi:hypothetical protein
MNASFAILFVCLWKPFDIVAPKYLEFATSSYTRSLRITIKFCTHVTKHSRPSVVFMYAALAKQRTLRGSLLHAIDDEVHSPAQLRFPILFGLVNGVF